jgi:predicted ester cyclase
LLFRELPSAVIIHFQTETSGIKSEVALKNGTNQRLFFGVPATGKPLQAQTINFYHLSDGRLVKEYGQPDMLAIMAQIGAAPLN